MARPLNLNSHRTSHDIADTFPTRRFTDTQLQSSEFVRTSESKYKFQKNSYFSGLLSKPKNTALSPPAAVEERSFHASRSGHTKPLDMLFFSRKNAIVAESMARSPLSPRTVATGKPADGSPILSRLSLKKLSIASGKSVSNAKDTLKLRVVELEKRLKNFEKVSRTHRAELSGDRLARKTSVKQMFTHHLQTPLRTIASPGPFLASPRTLEEQSVGEKTGKNGRDATVYSMSKHEGSLKSQLNTGGLVEKELNRLRDRITSVFSRDQKVIRALDRSGL